MNIAYQHQHHGTFASAGLPGNVPQGSGMVLGLVGVNGGGGGGGAVAGPSRLGHGHGLGHGHEGGSSGKKRKDLSGRVGKELSLNDRRDETRFYTENISTLHAVNIQLSTKPEAYNLFNLRLLPLSVERSAILAQLEMQETYALEAAEVAYEEERERVEDEWKRGRERVKERLMEGIEERRKRAREDKEGEGTGADATIDSQTRPHITRKLRNKLGTSPPPTPIPAVSANGITPGAISNLPITSGPFLNPHSLNVDEIPSPFPLPLISTTSSSGSANQASTTTGGGPGGGRRRPKGSGTHQSQAIGGLGKSLLMLGQCYTHEGTPGGAFETVNGVSCYVATPEGDYDKTKVLLFLTDIFGYDLVNARLLADDFAKNGYKTIIPDYLNGDPVPLDAHKAGQFDLKAWLANHGQDATRPPLDKVIEGLKEQGVSKFAATGYCLGGRYVFDLAFENIISVSIASHPTLLQIPADLDKYVEQSKAPLLIVSCSLDHVFPVESSLKADKVLGDGNFSPGYKRVFFEGFTHEGTPTGTVESINGIPSYVATPEGDYDKTKVLLFLTDIFGHELNNARLLADDFARNGYKTVIPDYLNGDPIPTAAFDGGKFDLMAWLGKHGQDVTRPPLDKVIEGLKGQGVSKFAATGYCFGARYVFDLAFENIITVSIVSHPSLLQVPADLEKYTQVSKAPLLINSCSIDQMFPIEASQKADEIFGDGKFAPGYKRAFFEGMHHGFATRGDITKKDQKEAKEGAFKEAVMWLKKYW
ncbi:hypothetical protein D9758_007640 [Tetrapyrgos nigripes]|uniref:Dienelactone hydrolase domain-containing protein n=1 Tax=Tetrapyrgos nigripes TaxID=182062 RepID=A0A8H5LK06_9AGAR|nr:hypothetical protein D9758_007640 [Tetrapyrgos nigripes]